MGALQLLWLWQNEAVTYEWIKREYLSKSCIAPSPQVTGLAQMDRRFCGLFCPKLNKVNIFVWFPSCVGKNDWLGKGGVMKEIEGGAS